MSWIGEIEEGCECPVYLAGQYRDLMLARSLLEKGLLPARGGWAEQPYYWMQAMVAIGQEAAQVERERLERLKTMNKAEL